MATSTEPRSRSDGTTSEFLTSVNPRTGEVIGRVRANSPGEVTDAVAEARKVAAEWASVPPQGRAHMMKAVRHEVYRRVDEIVETVSAEAGKPPREALMTDVLPVLIMLRYLEYAAPRTLKPEGLGGALGLFAGAFSRLEWRPFGVVGAITPWNYPMTNCFLAFAPALFAGNAVVIKPSEVTPRSGELVRELLDPLPPGVATVVQGGGEVGAALVDAPCDKISFIGSPPTGRKICEAAAKHLTPVVMELGGNDAAIVCADADLDVASSGILWGSFFNAGQTCCSIERSYVVDRVADEFEDRLLTKLQKVKQGEQVGPLTFPRQLDIVRHHVEDALSKGATLRAGGPDAGIKNENGSLWFAPTVLTDVTDEMEVLKEETFGPVLSVVRVRDEAEAVRRANEDGVNLTASVWTKDRATASRLAQELRAGTVTVNLHGETPAAPWTPWGGVGDSGFGRLNGALGIREFVVPVHVARSAAGGMKRLWWYGYDDDTESAIRAVSDIVGSPSVGAKFRAVGKLGATYLKAIKNKI